MKCLRFLVMILFVLASSQSFATTYYVDITNGNDANNGTSKITAWQHAPGMNDVTGIANSAVIHPGDSIILRGCQTWGNASFPWYWLTYAGTSGNNIYIGVDQTWWDSTVSGCSTSWNRPILNPGALPVKRSNNDERIFLAGQSYITFDNFEIVNVLCADDGAATSNETHIIDAYGTPYTGMIFSNLYIHGWVNPYFSVGTGNVSAGSFTITNFVPYSYSPLPLTTWPSIAHSIQLQEINPFGAIPVGNNSPTVSSISGSDPYTIVFTNGSAASSNCVGCVIQLGEDNCRIFAGNEVGNPGQIVENSVIDGSDTVQVQYNPYSDCGLSEGNNNWCGASAVGEWRGPQIWRNNVVRYLQSAAVGACTEWSGNLIEDIRPSGTDPTSHTNGIECLNEIPSNGATLSYNNVIRHTNNSNANSASGLASVGLLNQYTPQAGTTAYVFNNVVYDTLQNVPLGLYTGGSGCCGSAVLFNNTVDGGPAWTSRNYDLVNSCPSSYTACTFENNHLISNISSSALSSCGSNCTHTTNLLQSFANATAQGYTLTETFAYSSVSGGLTIGAGTVASSICSTITGINAAAGSACLSDTTYGATYKTTNHTALTGARPPNPRGPAWDIGAYFFVPPPGAPGPLTATPH